MSDDGSTLASLDPVDRSPHRRVAHEALDLVPDHQQTVAGEPAWRPIPPYEEARLVDAMALTEATTLYRSAGFEEVEPFDDEPQAHHRFEKHIEVPVDAGSQG